LSPESENWPKKITAHNTSMVIVPTEVCIGSWNSAATGGQRLGEEKVLACWHLNRCRLGNQLTFDLRCSGVAIKLPSI
jgi:hypothetical protein